MRFPHHLRTAFDHAIQQLRDGRPGESGYGRRIALVLTIPTYEDPVARDIRRSASGELYVVRTLWSRALDVAAAGPQRPARGAASRYTLMPAVELTTLQKPSLRSQRVNVDPVALDALLESVLSATVCCRPQHSEPPLDATVYELTFGEELHETRYRWSGVAPRDWFALEEFASRLIRLVDQPAAAGVR
jgi:hypothetical protein